MIKINVPQTDLNSLVDNHWDWFSSLLNDRADWFVDAKKDWVQSRIQTRQDFILKTLNLNSKTDIETIIRADYTQMLLLISSHPDWAFHRGKGANYSLRNAIQRAFGYNLFTSVSAVGWSALKLFDSLHLNVCPYCNSERIGALKNGSGRYNYKSPMDHFFPESIYPVLSCSFYNLIPACTNCNSLKKDLDTYKEEIIYPYLEEFGNNGNFRVRIDLRWIYRKATSFEQRLKKKVDVTIKPQQGITLLPKIKKSVNRLDIKSVYTDLHQDDVKDFLSVCRSSVKIRVKYFSKFRFDKEKILTKLHPYQRADKREFPLRKFKEDVLDQVCAFLK